MMPPGMGEFRNYQKKGISITKTLYFILILILILLQLVFLALWSYI